MIEANSKALALQKEKEFFDLPIYRGINGFLIVKDFVLEVK